MGRAWAWLRDWIAAHPVELRLSFRVMVSAVLSLAVSHLLHLQFALWAILTAVLLTQVSVGQSLRATIDYLASTLGGGGDGQADTIQITSLTSSPIATSIAAGTMTITWAPVTFTITNVEPTNDRLILQTPVGPAQASRPSVSEP